MLRLFVYTKSETEWYNENEGLRDVRLFLTVVVSQRLSRSGVGKP